MKKLSEYVSSENVYKDDKGEEWLNLTDFLHCGILEFCGCGSPENILDLLYNLFCFEHGRRTKQITYEQCKEQTQKYFIDNIDYVILFFKYLLDKKELLEHGSSVYSGWPCENFFEALIVWKDEQ